MINNSISRCLEYAVGEVCKQVVKNRKSVNWKISDENFLWTELVACILGSQVQYEHSQAATSYLLAQELLNIESLKHDPSKFEKDIADALGQAIFPPFNKIGGRKYRYPKLKANHIRRTAEQIYLSGYTIKDILQSSNDEKDARLMMMSFAVGVGPKQASLFLRNIGFAKNLAILDTHILKYVSVIGLSPQPAKGVSSLHRYEIIEQALRSYSKKFQTNLAHIDTAIWIVMRTCSRENIIT